MESSNRNGILTNSIELVAETFSRRHGAAGRIFRAPGRVNLIGEHTDYNDGFVMPAAIGFSTYVAVGLRSGRTLNVYSIDYGESASIDLDSLKPGPKGVWTDYVRGVAAGLLAHGIKVPGANLVIKGDVPIGAGLSSSAAIEVSTAYALLAASDANLDGRTIAAICQRAEHEYAGTRSGIMDQFISCFGREDHALLLDCRSLEYDLLELPPMVSIVICNTMVKHELAGGEYNRRRADCEAGVRFLQQSLPDVRALRDVTVDELERFGAGMSERIFRRCRHVITEDARVLQAAEALRQRDLRRFGKLMMASHASLRDDYEVSCRELDVMVEISTKCGGVFGARMTGGGFGGCTVNLVEEESVDTFRSQVSSQYQQAIGIVPSIYVCRAAQGAAEVAGPTA